MAEGPAKLAHIQSYALFYGTGQEDRLSRYDAVILAPGGHTPEAIRRLNARGIATLAYISVLEVPRTGPAPEHVLQVDGKPFANEEFNNWVLDPRAQATRRRFLDQVQGVLDQGYSGVFLDTVDRIEEANLPRSLQLSLVPAAAQLVKLTRDQFDCQVVQNFGLHQLLPLTAPYLDGVCWEDFPYRDVGPVPAVHAGIRRMQRFNEQYGLRILVLNQGLASAREYRLARDAATLCGFLWYGTPRYIDLPGGHR